MRLLRNQGMERRYANEIVGFNTRMTDIAAAIGRVQLTKLAGWTEQRQATPRPRRTSWRRSPRTWSRPRSPTGPSTSTTSTPSARTDRDRLRARLTEAGVGTGVYYPIPIHRLPSFADGRGPGVDLPETERACREVAVAAGPPGAVRGRPGARRGGRDEGGGGVS